MKVEFYLIIFVTRLIGFADTGRAAVLLHTHGQNAERPRIPSGIAGAGVAYRRSR